MPSRQKLALYKGALTTEMERDFVSPCMSAAFSAARACASGLLASQRGLLPGLGGRSGIAPVFRLPGQVLPGTASQ